ncbi:chitin binding peritrophin-A domain-containing protein [Streptomyces californicus]|uniref:chitin binding peritrophin-A domain-containing protein n=1 Tax=Streptomyces californicus TaxID=67351 RepID=UPI00296EE1A3|nr:chitin binding peritrophin-A domain-containing protein [Streptomyces californicus]MDW4918984.1 chitin binding peritrophin-A domain-containing protein [Streptomyces californicus]
MGIALRAVAVTVTAALAALAPSPAVSASSDHTHQAQRVCPPVDPEDRSAYAPVGFSAANFVECSNGVPYLFTCPAGLLWNLQLDVCDYPKNAHANRTGTRTVASTAELSADVTWNSKPLYMARVIFTDAEGNRLCEVETDATGHAQCWAGVPAGTTYIATYEGTDILSGSSHTTTVS